MTCIQCNKFKIVNNLSSTMAFIEPLLPKSYPRSNNQPRLLYIVHVHVYILQCTVWVNCIYTMFCTQLLLCINLCTAFAHCILIMHIVLAHCSCSGDVQYSFALDKKSNLVMIQKRAL